MVVEPSTLANTQIRCRAVTPSESTQPLTLAGFPSRGDSNEVHVKRGPRRTQQRVPTDDLPESQLIIIIIIIIIIINSSSSITGCGTRRNEPTERSLTTKTQHYFYQHQNNSKYITIIKQETLFWMCTFVVVVRRLAEFEFQSFRIFAEEPEEQKNWRRRSTSERRSVNESVTELVADDM